MRPPVLASTLTLCLAGLAAGRAAAAPTAGSPAVVEVFSVLNADEYPDTFVVVYPTRCDEAPAAAGEAARDYAVVTAGVETPMTGCRGSQLYVVERAGFDEVGKQAVPGLDALTPGERAEFFARDRRAHETRHRVTGQRRLVGPTERLRKIHDVLRIEREEPDFFVIGERVIYGYVDGTEEVIPFIAGRRPPPTGRSATPEDGPRVAISSSIPRWPWILGACVVFAGMALYGLRRRS